MNLILCTLLMLLCSSAFADQVTFINVNESTKQDIQEVIDKIERITSLKIPENFTVRGVSDEPRIAVAEFYDEIRLSPHALLLPIVAHEMGHLLVYYNLRIDIQEVNERHALNLKFKNLQAFTTEWSDLRLFLGSRYEPRLLSLHFEEVFGDLLSSHIFNDASIMDKLEAIKGYRDFSMPTPTDPHPHFWDEHYSLQSFGKYIYNAYLKPGITSPRIIFDAFYEVIKCETELYATSVADVEKSPWINSPLVSKRNGKLYFNKQDMSKYIDTLKENFDALMRKNTSNK